MNADYYFYSLLFVIHLPIIFLFLSRAIQRKWVSGSVIMHLAFTSYWGINCILVFLLAADRTRPVPIEERVLLVIQSILTIPLLAYVIPAMRETMGWPCIGALRDNAAQQERLRLELQIKLDNNKENYQKKLESLLRLVKRATRETEAQRQFIEGKEGMDTIRNWVDEQKTMLDEVNQKIISELPAEQVCSVPMAK